MTLLKYDSPQDRFLSRRKVKLETTIVTTVFCYGFGLIFQNAPTFWIVKKVKKFILGSSSRYFQVEEGGRGGERGVAFGILR